MQLHVVASFFDLKIFYSAPLQHIEHCSTRKSTYFIIKMKFIKPVQHTLKGFRVFLHNKFRKPVKGKNRELRLVFLTDINNSASFISISRRILFLTTDYCSLTMRVLIEFRS